MTSYAQGGNTGEAAFVLDLGFNFMTTYGPTSQQKLTVSSTITNTSDGSEVYFLTSGLTADANQGGGGLSAVPEPATLTLFGSGLAFVAAQVRRRKSSK